MTDIQTAVTELLDTYGIPYLELPHSKEVLTIEDAAEQRGVKPDEMVKCILLRDNKKRYVMACLMGMDKLNTQSVRNYVDVSHLSFASANEIEAVTGFKKGAVAAIAHKITIPVVFDKKIKSRDRVNISSGNRILGLELKREDLIQVVDSLIWGDIHLVE